MIIVVIHSLLIFDRIIPWYLLKNIVPFHFLRMSENNVTKNTIVSAESSYLSLLARILESGNDRMDRTGTGTRALFGETMRFDLSE